jgi:hypothetical protein
LAREDLVGLHAVVGGQANEAQGRGGGCIEREVEGLRVAGIAGLVGLASLHGVDAIGGAIGDIIGAIICDIG